MPVYRPQSGYNRLRSVAVDDSASSEGAVAKGVSAYDDSDEA